MMWFFDSFIVVDTTIERAGLNQSSETLIKQLSYTNYDGNSDFDSLRNKKCYLKAEGVMRLMEYTELEEARDSAKKARRWSIIALVFFYTRIFSKHYLFANRTIKIQTTTGPRDKRNSYHRKDSLSERLHH